MPPIPFAIRRPPYQAIPRQRLTDSCRRLVGIRQERRDTEEEGNAVILRRRQLRARSRAVRADDSTARQRAAGPCDDGGDADLRAGAGAAVGRGSAETLSRISCSVACSLAISSVICCWVAASCSTLCRSAARPSDIALSCCTSGEGVAGTVGATMSGAVRAAVCGANQRSRGDDFPIISLAASP